MMQHEKRPLRRLWFKPLTAVMMVGCAANYAPYEEQLDSPAFASTEEAVAACEGDDLQYDFNGFAASLATATAMEIGRWDVTSDFKVSGGKLQLSSTGELHCANGCDNVRALLALQDDATSSVPYHSPSVFRQKLSQWYADQKQQLDALVKDTLAVNKGVYRLRNRSTGKLMVVDQDATSDLAVVESRDRVVSDSRASEWELTLNNTKYRLKNSKSGLCLALGENSAWNGVWMRQRNCNSSDPLQDFYLARVGPSALSGAQGFFALRTGVYNKALSVASSNNDSPVLTSDFNFSLWNQYWSFEPVGSGSHQAPDHVATAVYSLTALHSGLALGVQGGSAAEGVHIEQAAYNASDDRFHWYVANVGDGQQLVNRRSGLCMSQSSTWDSIVQRPCSSGDAQLFVVAPSGAGSAIQLISKDGRTLEITDASTWSGAWLKSGGWTGVEGDGGASWRPNAQFRLTPIIAGEPHRLSFSHTTADGPCGDYYWFDIRQPNGDNLRSPKDSFIQLIFAGGKRSLGGRDVNPFIAQLSSGDQVAIDPSGMMLAGHDESSGSCAASDILYDRSGAAAGSCCLRYNGAYGTFRRSSWSANTFLCQ